MSIGSSLGRFVPREETDPAELERKAVEAWRRRGKGLVDPQEIDSEWLKRGITAWLNKRYGERL